MATMSSRPGTAKVYEAIRGFAEQVKTQPFVAV
jgi:hypothetical protein